MEKRLLTSNETSLVGKIMTRNFRKKVKVIGMLVKYCMKFARDSNKQWAHSRLKNPLEEKISLKVVISGLCSFGNPHRKGVAEEVGYIQE